MRGASSSAAGPRTTIVGNDTYAVLRAGTERGWGVAVVCGAGINASASRPTDAHVRFPALGAITGDWGGGYDVGMDGARRRGTLGGTARPEDGLEELVPGTSGARASRRSARRSTRARPTTPRPW